MPVTEGNRKQLEFEKRNYERKLLSLKTVAEEAQEAMEKLTLVFHKRAGETDQLFGSVTAQEVADQLNEKGFEIDRRKLELPHIKELGEYSVQVRLHPEVVAEIKIDVQAQE